LFSGLLFSKPLFVSKPLFASLLFALREPSGASFASKHSGARFLTRVMGLG
jgi:hypothetical protein